MATPPTATASTLMPQSQLLGARTPTQSDAANTAISSSMTPNMHSQDLTQSFYSTFLPSSFETQDAAAPRPQRFPPASTFTFIPDLYNLISRLRLLEGTPEFKGQGASTDSGSRTATSSPLLSRDGGTIGTVPVKPDTDPSQASTTIPETQQTLKFATDDSSNTEKLASSSSLSKPAIEENTGTGNTNTNKTQTLEIKDLPENIYEIKQAIQNARDVVASLPDIHRTTNEQESEIDQLERLIRGLKKRTAELAMLAGSSGTETQEDVVMQGVE